MGGEVRRLLVIDDDREIRALVGEVAIQLGFEVTSIGDSDNVGAADLAGVDVIALDLMMPGRDGVEVLRRLTGQVTASIIIMSGMGEKLVKSARQIAGARGLVVADTLHKPFRIAELRESLQKAVAANAGRTTAAAKRPAPQVTEREFADALARDEFVVHLQPQVRFADGAWVGVEALIRWQHPAHGLLYPDAFITLGSHPAYAVRFMEVVLRKAIAATRMLDREVGYGGSLSVNMAPSAMSETTLADRIVDWVDAERFDRARLILEVTETSIPSEELLALDIATRLRMRGIRLSVDDFGTGYSSLQRLDGAPFDELKIDMLFVRNADREAGARAILENAIRLGHDLQMKVVAEGVETTEAWTGLARSGCDIAQGYFISPPLPPGKLCEWALSGWGSGREPPAATVPELVA